jgi:hypothetical protein
MNKGYQDHQDYQDSLAISTMETVNIFEKRIDDCSETEWIPFYDLDLEASRFAD